MRRSGAHAPDPAPRGRDRRPRRRRPPPPTPPPPHRRRRLSPRARAPARPDEGPQRPRGHADPVRARRSRARPRAPSRSSSCRPRGSRASPRRLWWIWASVAAKPPPAPSRRGGKEAEPQEASQSFEWGHFAARRSLPMPSIDPIQHHVVARGLRDAVVLFAVEALAQRLRDQGLEVPDRPRELQVSP